MQDFDPVGLMLMVEQTELLPDKPGRRLIETTAYGYGTILGDPPAHLFAEVVFKIGWCGADQLHMLGEPVEGRLASAGMATLMVVLPDPEIEGNVEFSDGAAEKMREKLSAYRAKETLDFSELM